VHGNQIVDFDAADGERIGLLPRSWRASANVPSVFYAGMWSSNSSAQFAAAPGRTAHGRFSETEANARAKMLSIY
jgi:hypothetical protein